MTDTPNFRFRRDEDATDRWSVDLPHQCEEWTITAESRYADPPSHAEAVRVLHGKCSSPRHKIALTALRRREEEMP